MFKYLIAYSIQNPDFRNALEGNIILTFDGPLNSAERVDEARTAIRDQNHIANKEIHVILTCIFLLQDDSPETNA